MNQRQQRPGLGAVAPLMWLALLLMAVYRLPPDTTMAIVERSGVLRVCLPDTLPPLVTGTTQHPGIDVDTLLEVATRLELRLQLTRNPAIGRDFNPRNWRVTRAQCLVIAGGVIDSAATRGFIDTTTPHLETGWAAVATAGAENLPGATVGFHAGLSGLDRLALSAYLREAGATVELVSSRAGLLTGLQEGRFAVVVTDALAARSLAVELGAGATAMWLPDSLARYGVAFGLWKGDLTLKRRIEAVLSELRQDGTLAEILERYELGPLQEECSVCEIDGR